jgi:pantoate--beta-alanine ligase
LIPDLKLLKTIDDIKNEILFLRQKRRSIGFVPTMGALHEGHLSLLEKAKMETDVVICSIFVNPIQFNNKEDFVKYPKTLDADLGMLNKVNCDMVFTPSEKEIYPEPDNFLFNFGAMENVMEGKFRQGHFIGVVRVIKRFFEIIEPDRAYFGEKDFQQYLIIRKFSQQFFPDIEIVPCPIAREADGLAMSSRNMQLSAEERKMATILSCLLKEVKNNINYKPISELKKWVQQEMKKNTSIKLEYFEISDIDTLQPILKKKDKMKYIACIAAYIGQVRLIDNIIIEN